MRIIVSLLFLVGCVSPTSPTTTTEKYMDAAYYADPLLPTEPKVGIILVGDTGTGEPDQYKVADGIRAFCEKNQCDYGLLLGDNFYPTGVKSKNDKQFQTKFEDPYRNLSFRFYAVLGNHDTNEDAEIGYESRRWKMFGHFYAVRSPLVSCYGLDTNLGGFRNPFGTEQGKWLDTELSSEKSKWSIVFGHHPVFSGGEHGDSGTLKRRLKPLLEKHRVDFYVSGHDHDKQLIERDGVAYVVSGAGAKLRPTKASEFHKFSKSSLGFSYLLLSEKSATLKFLDVGGNEEFSKTYVK